jgi:SAM-dependent methyltransferase
MNTETARWLTTEEARGFIEQARNRSGGFMKFAESLRGQLPAELAAAVTSQAYLQQQAVQKFGDRASSLLFTKDGLEQASRSAVAAWRASRIVQSGAKGILDFGCGIGADALALVDAGIPVVGVEIDLATAILAEANLGSPVITGDVTALADSLISEHPGWGVFMDPARRTSSGRSWRVADLSPDWDFVTRILFSGLPVWVKMGPGFPLSDIPSLVAATWVSDHGDLVELELHNRVLTSNLSVSSNPSTSLRGASASERRGNLSGQESVHAVLLPDGLTLSAEGRPDDLAKQAVETMGVKPLGAYVIEPDPGVIRAGLYAQLPGTAWFLDSQVAYLSSDEPIKSPFLTCFRVDEVLDYNVKSIRSWVRDHQVGILEIKKRAVTLDPAALRKQLHPKGPASATLIIAHTLAGTKCLVVTRQ